MKFSVLLPTRDRLELLQLAVESVLRQGYGDFEIVISDNNSIEPVEEYVTSLSDERVVYTGFDDSVSVTENWNNTIVRATGDYLVMLGDDDALCMGYFDRLSQIVEAWDYPECIYTGAYMFTYKGVLPGVDYGTVYENKNSIFWRGSYEPYWLSRRQRLNLVNDAMRLYCSYGFNMQFVTISRRAVEKNTGEGGFFQTQYPDYYAMNNLLINTERFLVVEEPLVAIGTSKSSFGWYFHNKKEGSGNKALNIESGMERAASGIEDKLLPGTTMNTNWLTSMFKVYEDNRGISGLLPPDISRYRRKQIIYFVLLMSTGSCTEEEVSLMERRLGVGEHYLFVCLKLLSRLGGLGRRLLHFLHIASQKRSVYMLKALAKRLLRQAPVVSFTDDSTILEAERLIAEMS